ncbi:MAG: CobD/CbiB family protein [Betaproteobacteria bacterium]|nr:CobD/CbiB family protein [Betaproteobacteria bacterium]
MTLISLLIALLLEQVQPMRPSNAIQGWIDQQLRRLRLMAAPDEEQSIWVAWWLVVGGGALLGLTVTWLLGLIHPLLELLGIVAILYLTLGFRQFSHWFNEIQSALKTDDLGRAREVFQDWVRQTQADRPAQAAAERGDAQAIARESIRLALIAAQRHVFGVIFWFVILPGPSGALAYWLSVQILKAWSSPRDALSSLSEVPESEASAGDFGSPAYDAHSQVSERAFRWIDWLPVRVTAGIYAMVGNFEDAVDQWRSQASASIVAPSAQNDTERVLIAAGSGAMGVRLSLPDAPSGAESLDEFSVGGTTEVPLRDPDALAMGSAVGLVWRAVLVWFFMVLLFSLGRWFA